PHSELSSLLLIHPPPRSTLFPYTTLFRSLLTGALGVASTAVDVGSGVFIALFSIFFFLSTGDRIWAFVVSLFPRGARPRVEGAADRKSTRLNSSHSQISYAVFCLKKKKKF